MTAIPSTRYRLDDLRRWATALTSKLGVAPPRASALAGHLLWFDAAGAATHGIGTLPTWLDRLERKEIDPVVEGRATLEHAGTAVFDARHGLAPLALEAAASIASEKARDVGIGIVRVRNIGPTGPAAPVAASLAIGPFVAVILGPSSSLTIALPTVEGLPAIYDSDLEGAIGEGSATQADGWSGALGPWISSMAGGDGWMILAVSVASMESLSNFHERLASHSRGTIDGRGQIWPETLARRLQGAREDGVILDKAVIASLKDRAGRSNVPWPDTCEA